MAAVYRRLINEGILSTVRASRTILRGRDSSRNLQVRGLIGMPLSEPRLHMSRNYRECSVRMREELHARGFAILPFYFQELEVKPHLVIERANKEKVDTVIWFLADGADRNTRLQLRDLAIRFVGINIGGLPNPFCRYEVRWGKAILTILDEWRTGMSLETITIVLEGNETAAEKQKMNRLCQMVSTEKIHCELVKVPEGHICTFLKSLCAKKNNGILLAGLSAAMLASRAPSTVAEILKTCSVAWVDGPPDSLLNQRASDLKIDLVSVDWRAISERIARDILSGAAFRQSETTIFEAEAHLQAPVVG